MYVRPSVGMLNVVIYEIPFDISLGKHLFTIDSFIHMSIQKILFHAF
jgi:hypothetical protein